ncbi:MAG TPA: hypothetical protein VHX88_20435 [Solirubrobacteraceae bacterium]|jgi:hypothetical protein|nr:hypothetical protein [Solirubrobacteraceae bacterium]
MASDATLAPAGGNLLDGMRLRVARARIRGGVRDGILAAIAGVGLVGGALLIVVAAANAPTFLVPESHSTWYPSWLSGPLGGLWPGLPSSIAFDKDLFTFSLVGMFLAYLLALRHAPRVRARWTVLVIVALHVVMVLSPPLSLTDVFNYLNYGRMEIVHHLNPYATVPILEPHNDPTFPLSNWHHLLSPYGPLFTIFTFGLVPLGVAGGLWTYKVLLMCASLGSIFLVWRCAELLGRDPIRAVVFIGCNPLVLIWGLGGDHNDFFMVLLLMVALYSALRVRRAPSAPGAASPWGVLPVVAPRPPAGTVVAAATIEPLVAGGARLRARMRRIELSWWEVGAGVALVAAVAVKASVAVLVPVVLLGTRNRRSLFAGLVLGVLLVGTMSLIAFGTHLPDLTTQQQQVTIMSLPNLFGLAIGVGGETNAIHTACDVLLILTVVVSSAWAWRKRVIIGPAATATVALLVTLSWVLPWYVLWILPLAALTRWRWLSGFAVAYSIYLILAWFPLQSNVLQAIHWKPSDTSVAIAHQDESNRLLR